MSAHGPLRSIMILRAIPSISTIPVSNINVFIHTRFDFIPNLRGSRSFSFCFFFFPRYTERKNNLKEKKNQLYVIVSSACRIMFNPLSISSPFWIFLMPLWLEWKVRSATTRYEYYSNLRTVSMSSIGSKPTHTAANYNSTYHTCRFHSLCVISCTSRSFCFFPTNQKKKNIIQYYDLHTWLAECTYDSWNTSPTPT